MIMVEKIHFNNTYFEQLLDLVFSLCKTHKPLRAFKNHLVNCFLGSYSKMIKIQPPAPIYILLSAYSPL